MSTQLNRLYHVVSRVTDKSMQNYGKKTYWTTEPISHKEACTFLSKLTRYDWRDEYLEEYDPEFHRQYALALATGPALMARLRSR